MAPATSLNSWLKLAARPDSPSLHPPLYPPHNGKAERFIQTSLREWAYARSYQHSTVRAAHLLSFLHHYNWHRPHSALDHHPPISKLNLSMNNLLSLHS